jgi:diadenosine tetraphosphate (Ap4A) HIT family hydrolase
MTQLITNFDELIEFLQSKRGLQMSHIYKPVMLLSVINRGGRATKRDVATDFALSDTQQVEFYRSKIVHKMPGWRLVRDGLLDYDGEAYAATGVLATLNSDQKAVVREVLSARINDYLDTRKYPFGDSNNDAVRGSVRYEVLKRAGGRCELCGESSRNVQIDVDHIIPRSKQGSNDPSNLQALCRTCNAQKRDRDDTDFHALHEAYAHREQDCIFCQLPAKRIIAQSPLALVFRDQFPVTELHTLIIPRRHIPDYDAATQAEVTAMNRLVQEQRAVIQSADPLVTGFNIGLNCGEDAGQTIFHAHMHLIPRRTGDVAEPRGGVRHVMPGKGSYWHMR